MKQRAGGEPFDNRNHIYIGFGDDVALNRSIKRYAAVPAAREYVRQYATPTGRISDPMLTIHTTSDALVLGNDVTAYEVPAALAGTSDSSWPGLSTPMATATSHRRRPAMPSTLFSSGRGRASGRRRVSRSSVSDREGVLK